MIYKSRLSDGAKKDIQNQVRQALAYYLGQYVHMVKKYDNGISSRIAKRKKASKKVEEDSEDSGVKERIGEELQQSENYETSFLLEKSLGKPKGKGKVENAGAEKTNPNIVTVDLNKATPNQKKYVSNMLKNNEAKKPGRPKRNSPAVKPEPKTSTTNKRKSTAAAGKKKSPAKKKQRAIVLDDADEQDFDQAKSGSESEANSDEELKSDQEN